MRATVILTFFSLLFLTSVSFAQVGNNTAVLNPNLVSADEMAALPAMTEALAEAVIAARPLGNNLELDAALGDALSADQKAALHVELFLPIDLNSASNEEIQLVPGMSNRMVREFNEYRPYENLDEFRREIGKYVDTAEVARFEQYVFVPMDLNSASSEDFASIPGMSSRMVREFNEYKPYENIDEFRREIGKYVDENEVARLERYIYVGM